MKISKVLELFLAATNGDTARVINLIDEGEAGDINASNITGSTPLMAAALKGHTETVLALLSKGANVNAMDRGVQFTPLYCAVLSGCTRTVMVLLEHGAQVNTKTREGKTALDIATKGEIAKLLKAACGKV